ncbi:MAG: UvrD-helicase domain-containing protein [Chthoniobacter sp.]|nr:UvrD-helicase domain-containing protein [Chthoniobacter sp.]
MIAPLDQQDRTRFITELEQNFSVVASAGSGKTRAVTNRIIAIATSPRALEWLPALVVVTFTNRAADEMQQRARQSILEAGVSLEVLAAFNRAFFGTIHSFCVKLLRQHGHHLGLPGKLDLLTDDDALWMDFVQQQTSVGVDLTAAQRRSLLRLAPLRELMELGRHGGADAADAPGEFPPLEFDAVLAFAPSGSAKKTIPYVQERLRAWARDWAAGDGFLPLPECSSKAKEFAGLWEEALGPLREWLRRCALRIAVEVEAAYRAFRLAKGAINYDDQIALASQLLRHPEAARRIREKHYRVILDEAQDTDPTQFSVLLEIARPADATGLWPETPALPPRPGHFCMVGDFQQSIFGDRADLGHYRRIHETLIATGAGEAVRFTVTFRLDQAQLDFVNAVFPTVLHGSDGQVAYVGLNSRPGVLPGQVLRFNLGPLPPTDGWRDWQKTRHEAQLLAIWLRAQGLERLRAQRWSDVAILCPRKGWFPPLHRALREAGFAVQLQSERDLKGDSPAYAWFTALAVIMAAPHESYEVVGVLREIFGVSDHDLATYAEGESARFHLGATVSGRGPVADPLRLLAETRARILPLPLFSAMQELVRATELRARLFSLPADTFENLDAELDSLLTAAATAEAGQRTLADFAADLRDGFSATREVRAPAPDAIQLITCHKAKGSEWQAVIVPFFARGVSQRSRNYPRLLRHPQTGSCLAALDAADIDSDLKAALDAQSRQELERLLYVALTRARHTLVLAEDHALFSGRSGLPKRAPARLLNCADAAPFAVLPTASDACADTAAQQAAKSAQRAHELAVPPLAPLRPTDEDRARARATHFRKRNPSALAEAALADADPAAYLALTARAATGQSTGALYGSWWHDEFVEHLDWRADATAWDATFAAALPTAPDPAQAQREWALLRAALTTDTPLARLLTAPGLVAHTELPFLWPMDDAECLEGIMDLAVFDPAAGSWLILDWKTNRTTAAELPRLRAHYLPQLSAYWQTLTTLLDAPVTAGLYATATGTWLPYTATELAAEWEKLRHAPAEIARVLGER